MSPDLVNIIVWVVIIAVVVGVVSYLRKRPAVAEALKTDATSIIDRLSSLAHNQHETIAQQATVIASPPVQAVINTPAVAPAPVAPAKVEPTLASEPARVAGARVDPQFPAGTAGTVTLPATGHVLSIPQPENGELVLSYAGRTIAQTHGDPAIIGGLILAQGHGPSQTGDAKTDWPILVDWYFNARAYMTADQRAQADAAQAQYAALAAAVAANTPAAPPAV